MIPWPPRPRPAAPPHPAYNLQFAWIMYPPALARRSYELHSCCSVEYLTNQSLIHIPNALDSNNYAKNISLPVFYCWQNSCEPPISSELQDMYIAVVYFLLVFSFSFIFTINWCWLGGWLAGAPWPVYRSPRLQHNSVSCWMVSGGRCWTEPPPPPQRRKQLNFVKGALKTSDCSSN